MVGWRPPDYGFDDVGGLFLAIYQDGQLVFRASVGTGLTDRMRTQIRDVLPNPDRTDKIMGISMADPRLPPGAAAVAGGVEYTEITRDGLVCHPSCKGLR